MRVCNCSLSMLLIRIKRFTTCRQPFQPLFYTISSAISSLSYVCCLVSYDFQSILGPCLYLGGILALCSVYVCNLQPLSTMLYLGPSFRPTYYSHVYLLFYGQPTSSKVKTRLKFTMKVSYVWRGVNQLSKFLIVVVCIIGLSYLIVATCMVYVYATCGLSPLWSLRAIFSLHNSFFNYCCFEGNLQISE
jgi:hypothetical protein